MDDDDSDHNSMKKLCSYRAYLYRFPRDRYAFLRFKRLRH